MKNKCGLFLLLSMTLASCTFSLSSSSSSEDSQNHSSNSSSLNSEDSHDEHSEKSSSEHEHSHESEEGSGESSSQISEITSGSSETSSEISSSEVSSETSSEENSSEPPEEPTDRYMVNATQWDQAFSLESYLNVDILNEVRAEMFRGEELGQVQGIRQHSAIDNGRIQIDASQENEIYFDKDVFLDYYFEMNHEIMTEAMFEAYLADMVENGSLLTQDGNSYRLTMHETSPSHFYLIDSQDTYYEYDYHETEERYHRTLELGQVLSVEGISYLPFTMFKNALGSMTYDTEGHRYWMDKTTLLGLMNAPKDLEIDAALSLSFDRGKLLSMTLDLAFEEDGINTERTLKTTFSDYGSVHVDMPENVYVCDHIGFDVYSERTYDFHTTQCEGCGGVITYARHTYVDGECSECHFAPTIAEPFDIVGYLEGQATLIKNAITGEPISLRFSSYSSVGSYDPEQDAFITRYDLSDSDVTVILIEKQVQVEGETCLYQTQKTYQFYEFDKKIADDFTFKTDEIVEKHTYEYHYADKDENCVLQYIGVCIQCGASTVDEYVQHQYALVSEVKDDQCHVQATYTCLDCGASYVDEYIEHTISNKITYDEVEGVLQASLVCDVCQRTFEGKVEYTYQNDLYHYFYITYDDEDHGRHYVDDDSYHTLDENGRCTVCGYQSDYRIYPISDCETCEVLVLLDENNTIMSIELIGFTAIENDIGQYLGYGCPDCGLIVDIQSDSVENGCVIDYQSIYSFYDGETVIATLTTHTYEEVHDYEKTSSILVSGCIYDVTYTCSQCGKEKVLREETHAYVLTQASVDEYDPLLHYLTYTCTGCGDSYIVNHYGHHDSEITIEKDGHCIEYGTVTCEYCGLSYTAYFGQSHQETNVNTTYSNTDFGFVINQNICVDCGEVIDFNFDLISWQTTWLGETEIIETIDGSMHQIVTYTGTIEGTTVEITCDYRYGVPSNESSCHLTNNYTITVELDGVMVYEGSAMNLYTNHETDWDSSIIFGYYHVLTCPVCGDPIIL